MYRCLLVLVVCTTLLRTGMTNETETAMTLESVPASVRTAILKEANSAVIESIVMESDEDVTCFEAQWRVNGVRKEIVVSTDGVLLESEQTVSITSLPTSVKDQLIRHFGTTDNLNVTRNITVHFEAEGTIDGENFEVVLSPTGKVLGREEEEDEGEGEQAEEDERNPNCKEAAGDKDDADEDDDEDEDLEGDTTVVSLSDCPDRVSKTLRREATGGSIEEIVRSREDGTIVYEAEVELDGHDYEITVREDGLLIEKELEEDD